MDAVNLSVGIAFLGGLLSFLSPCVFPLIPAYVSYMSARAAMQVNRDVALVGVAVGAGGVSTVKAIPNRAALFFHGTMFVLGEMFVFVVFGIAINVGIRAISSTSYVLERDIAHFGGLLVIFFGLYVLGVVGWILKFLINNFAWEDAGKVGLAIKSGLERFLALLYSDTRRQVSPKNRYGYIGSGLMGMAFAAGWTACIGPTYSLILTMISQQNVGQAVFPLVAYSLGLGMPFLIATLALDRIRGFLKRIQRQMRWIEVASGVLLIVMGFLLFTDHLSDLSSTTVGLTGFQANLEYCTTHLADGTVPSGDYNLCMQNGQNYNVTVTPAPKS